MTIVISAHVIININKTTNKNPNTKYNYIIIIVIKKYLGLKKCGRKTMYKIEQLQIKLINTLFFIPVEAKLRT
jgi:hypothetical protein